MKKKMSIKARNAMHPGYGECYKCGGNWGWKKGATHDTGGGNGSGLFLFCEECDKVVTVEERWAALDEWKQHCLSPKYAGSFLSDAVYIDSVLNTEFVEWPRESPANKED